MVWFYARGTERRSCETRLALDTSGYELVIRGAEGERVEHFAQLQDLLAREHQLLTAWRAQGWRSVTIQPPRRALRDLPRIALRTGRPAPDDFPRE
jgi:hypothetical protein